MAINSSFTPSANVISGWNRKINSDNVTLSELVPFMNLIVLFDDYEMKVLPQNLRDKIVANSINFTFANDVSQIIGNKSIVGIPLAKIESQLQSLNQKGGVGLNSLDINRGTKESLNVTYKLGMTVTDAEIFDTNIEYTSLIQLNSLFLIMYGWNGSNSKLFKDPPSFDSNNRNITIDLTDENFGFWRADLCRLYKFDFSFAENGHIDITLSFVSPFNSALMYIKNITVIDTIKNLLTNARSDFFSNNAKTILNIDSNLQSPIIKVSVKKSDFVQIVNPETGIMSTSEKIETMEIDAYYYLGWIMESLAYAINARQAIKDVTNVQFEYSNIEGNTTIFESIVANTYNPNDNTKTFASLKIFNVFQIPLNKDKVDSIISNVNMSMIDIIKNILDSSVIALPGVMVSTDINNGIIKIFVSSVNLGHIEEEINAKILGNNTADLNTIYVDYGTSNSLCQSIDLTSKLDPTALDTYKLPIPISGTENDILDFSNPNSIGGKLAKAGLDKDILLIIDREKKDNQGKRIDAQTVISKLIDKDARNYKAIVSALLNEQNVFGYLLGYYLKRTTVVLHGITGINGYHLIVIRGIIKKMQGIYNVLDVTEQITSDSYITILECGLRKPFQEDLRLT